jgi:hypothetical protein
MNLDEMPKRPANWNQVSTCTYTTLTYGQPMQQLAYHRIVTQANASRALQPLGASCIIARMHISKTERGLGLFAPIIRLVCSSHGAIPPTGRPGGVHNHTS